MLRSATLFGAAAALLAGAAAQDAMLLNCQSDLVAMSTQFNAACCADAANCASGAPRQCSAACAAVSAVSHLHTFAVRLRHCTPARRLSPAPRARQLDRSAHPL